MAFQDSQWPAFEELALQELAAPKERMLLRIWRYPSFDAYSWWQFSDHCVWHDTWDRAQDGAMVADPLEGLRRGHLARPTLQRRCLAISSEEIDGVLQSLAEVRIPLVRSLAIAIDGVSYGVEAPPQFSATWNVYALPEAWEPLQDCMDRTLVWLTERT